MRRDEARPQFASGAARYLTTPEKIKVRFESWTQEALNGMLRRRLTLLGTSGEF